MPYSTLLYICFYFCFYFIFIFILFLLLFLLLLLFSSYLLYYLLFLSILASTYILLSIHIIIAFGSIKDYLIIFFLYSIILILHIS
jgi:hypothetical protein